MSIVNSIQKSVTESLQVLYDQPFTERDFQVNQTKPEFEGDYAVVMFSLVKTLKLSPDTIGGQLGKHLVENYPGIYSRFNIIKGFLNLTIAEDWWIALLQANYQNACYGKKDVNGQKVMVEYSSPNTNKPLHLGHLRNNFLGWSVSEILKANGYEVIKSCIVNDRGIHICKSMIAWQLFAGGATPASSHTKGDHLVGKYYVQFNEEMKRQMNPILEKIYSTGECKGATAEENNKILQHLAKLITLKEMLSKEIAAIDADNIASLGEIVQTQVKAAISNEYKWKNISKIYDDKNYFDLEVKEKENKQKQLLKIIKPLVTLEDKIENERSEIEDIAQAKTEIMQATKQMLLDWEEGKPEVIELWKTMNHWVYEGFEVTYKRIGSNFDVIYYESQTYLSGKSIVQQGLDKKVFYQKEDGSIWIDLTADGLDEKIVQRRDGTSVYITQDIGLALQKYEEYKIDQSIYVIGNEQNYHMKVLQLICKKLGMPNADNIFHLSYGMVELTTGKMKSREGTVVDADDLVDEMVATSKRHTEELGKVKDFTTDELSSLYDTIGLGAMKFYLLRVDPKKTIVFNPEDSIDFHGFTGPFVQYTYARIQSIVRKNLAGTEDTGDNKEVSKPGPLFPLEKEVIVNLEQYPSAIEEAAQEHNPAVIANYVFNLAKTFNSFYSEHSVANAETVEKKQLRLQIAGMTANVIKSGMQLLGIRVPERM